MSGSKKQSSEAAVREIRRRTGRRFSAEEKIRIVLEGLRGERVWVEYRVTAQKLLTGTLGGRCSL